MGRMTAVCSGIWFLGHFPAFGAVQPVDRRMGPAPPHVGDQAGDQPELNSAFEEPLYGLPGGLGRVTARSTARRAAWRNGSLSERSARTAAATAAAFFIWQSSFFTKRSALGRRAAASRRAW